MPLRNNKMATGHVSLFWETIPRVPYVLARKQHLGHSLHTSGRGRGRKSGKGCDSGGDKGSIHPIQKRSIYINPDTPLWAIPSCQPKTPLASSPSPFPQQQTKHEVVCCVTGREIVTNLLPENPVQVCSGRGMQRCISGTHGVELTIAY